MRPKTLILMFVAVACGLAASFMTSKVLSERAQKPSDQVSKRVALLVAKRNLPVAQLIKDPKQAFDVKLVEEGNDPKKAIKSGPVEPSQVDDALTTKLYEQVKDHYLSKGLSEGQFVTQEDLRGKEEGGLSATMEKGMRAVTVKVDAASLVGGFALPNSRVDVVWVRRGGNTESVATTLLQNVLVLAVDTTNVRPEDKQAVPGSTVTLQVTPEQSQKVALAVAMGDLRLTLRAYGDDATKPIPLVNLKSITNPSSSDAASVALEADTEIGPLVSSGQGVVPPWMIGNNIPDVTIQPPAGGPGSGIPDAKIEEPRMHLMIIQNGEGVRRVKFPLNDENAEPIIEEVRRSSPDRAPRTLSPVPPTPEVDQ